MPAYWLPTSPSTASLSWVRKERSWSGVGVFGRPSVNSIPAKNRPGAAAIQLATRSASPLRTPKTLRRFNAAMVSFMTCASVIGETTGLLQAGCFRIARNVIKKAAPDPRRASPGERHRG